MAVREWNDATGIPGDRILSVGEVTKLLGVSDTTLWRIVKAGDFPVKLKISQRRVGWLKSEVLDWLDERKTATIQAGGQA